MDSLFGIGLWELALIFVIALIFLGPKDIARHAFWLGRQSARLMREARAILAQFDVNQIAGDDDLRTLREEASNLNTELQGFRRDLRKPLDALTKDVRDQTARLKKDLDDDAPETGDKPTKKPAYSRPSAYTPAGDDDEPIGSIAPPSAPPTPAPNDAPPPKSAAWAKKPSTDSAAPAPSNGASRSKPTGSAWAKPTTPPPDEDRA